jgi:hypothetical protein
VANDVLQSLSAVKASEAQVNKKSCKFKRGIGMVIKKGDRIQDI